VSSKTDHKPVLAATVKAGEQTAVTDTKGRFTIDKVATGSAPIAVEAIAKDPTARFGGSSALVSPIGSPVRHR
jgi:hypothetical protein